MALKGTPKSTKVTIYWCKRTKYIILNRSYSTLAYFTAIIRIHYYSFT